MKLILENDGVQVEVKEIEAINANSEMLFFFLSVHIRKPEIEALEAELFKKTGKKCIVLDSVYSQKILGS